MVLQSTLAAFAFAMLAGATPLSRRDVVCTGSGQACAIANMAGSTGNPIDYSVKTSGGSKEGLQCIASHNPDFDPSKFQGSLKRRDLLEGYSTLEGRSFDGGLDDLHKRGLMSSNDLLDGACKPNILIFARGTMETGNMGITVGPALKNGLSLFGWGKWAFQGVEMEATIAADNCLGLEGGVVATQYIELAASKCPDSKIVVAGYSLGGMVAHNGVANASDAAKAKVVGVVTFGDPFNGAPIKGYPSNQIKTYCSSSDKVCNGEFVIGIGHLSYTLVDTTMAVSYITSIV